MYLYDIRKQIRTENRKKLIGEISVMIVLVFIAAVIILTCDLKNPFVVVKPSSDKQLEKAFNKGVDYVSLKNADLNFTGYYKTNDSNEVIYNCYATTFDKKQYFVFIPASRSGDDASNPDQVLENYSFTARMENDWSLIETVSKDYETDRDEFLDYYGVSGIILNEAKADRNQMYLLWALFGLIIIISMGYLLTSLLQVKELTRDKRVRELGRYGDIENILNTINKEVQDEILYDGGKLKLTKSWLISFSSGAIHILPVHRIKQVTLKQGIKKIYGLFSIGEALYLELKLEQDITENIYIKSKSVGQEIMEYLESLIMNNQVEE